ncbi:Peptidase inhibitor I9 [Musa troglodytarum]|uniref:Peptidase inhibitor I9 n=1 Tax=Musa troglodytarum TaxID=320322 RepID=A0A9E7FKN1_9LILI|nr:Peptidase inhibitor I9 [Musa troglodytarum]
MAVIASFLFLFLWCSLPLDAHDFHTYIVQLHPHSIPGRASATGLQNKLHWHLSFLDRATFLEGAGDASSRLLYSYHSALEGFAARLTEDEVAALRALPGVIAVRPDSRLELHTTYSYTFLGLNFAPGGAWSRSRFGQGTIIGVLDTGVWPESPSFRDDRMPPVPTRWRGVCQEGEHFNSSNCNRKLIGARFYAKGHRINYPLLEYVSPRDAHGHGTHTSSTAAGAAVPRASVLGLGAGEARGMAPGAHIAAYKVCWFNGCYSSDILAGMDDAIRDGVDVLSLSLGGDSIAIGSFRATERGVVVVCAAGNNGPVPSSVANEAPWITTVGASTLDRRFPAFVRLGNGRILYGESMFPGNHFSKNGGKELELIYEAAKLVYGGTRIRRSRAPAVALFSSRGPSLTNPSVLKPDLIAPGVNIIDRRKSNFTVLSGTSMACPHASGIAALVRSTHPSWSPAAIRSAMMTTADVVDHLGKPIMDGDEPAGVFSVGAGHVNPARAVDPGLVYDVQPEDYIAHLCSLGYNQAEIFTITHRNISCGKLLQGHKQFNLNYPSISVTFTQGRTSTTIQRKLTNVGLPDSVYTVQVTAPPGVTVTVTPKILAFGGINEIKSYTVVFESKKGAQEEGSVAEGQLMWVHRGRKKYKVRSPISVTWGA